VINVFDVAKYILHSIGDEISTMMLQKLCYYCQAWHLVWNGVPLFPENFVRRDNGPVCMEFVGLYRGRWEISEDHVGEKYLGGKKLSRQEKDTINQILEDYGMHGGAQLCEIAHGEDPWKNTPRMEVISQESILNYYSSLDPDEAPKTSTGKKRKKRQKKLMLPHSPPNGHRSVPSRK
jgi:uncharacterized phage-associated protein